MLDQLSNALTKGARKSEMISGVANKLSHHTGIKFYNKMTDFMSKP